MLTTALQSQDMVEAVPYHFVHFVSSTVWDMSKLEHMLLQEKTFVEISLCISQLNNEGKRSLFKIDISRSFKGFQGNGRIVLLR